MQLSTLDWSLIIIFFIISLIIGIYSSRSAGKSANDFFLSGRNMPWWLLGVSMVATTFSADTPNLVTDIVRKDGVAGNWVWWAFLLTGMLTVFVYAKLWRRSGVVTDLEFYELRYSGKPAAFLRGFRSLYLGVLFNVVVMSTVCLAAIKIGDVLLGFSPIKTILVASIITVIYSSLGGLKGIILTDFFQFILAMIGTIWAAYIIVNLPEIGGLSNLLEHKNVIGKLDLIPDFNNINALIPLFVLPLAVQWWASYYPGAEPGGGGYVAQRMLSAKDEKNAIAATLFFNFAHYALRPWPWILIALASLILFPDLESLQTAFPNVDPSIINDDLAYPAMLSFLPTGLLGLVIASLIAAFMSTISSHLNWGASYIVNDFYKRFIKPNASEKELVSIGRISTIILMFFSGIIALNFLDNAKQAFNIIVLLGAGTGLLFILRWFWWRINAYSEIAAMVISFLVALYLEFFHQSLGFVPFETHTKLLLGVGITTIGWIIVTLLTRPTHQRTLLTFYKLIKPQKTGWLPVIEKGLQNQQLESAEIKVGKLPLEIACMIIGSFTIYAALFGTGYWIYGNMTNATISTIIVILGILFLFSKWKKIQH